MNRFDHAQREDHEPVRYPLGWCLLGMLVTSLLMWWGIVELLREVL